MFSKEEASQIRHQFWATFGQYMAPVPSADDHADVNWINYKTGFKDVYFRMQTLRKSALIGVFLTHNDIELQELFFEQFMANKAFLEQMSGEEWEWELAAPDEHGRLISRIYCERMGVSIMNRNDWPALISFFKPRIVALDEFWSMAKVSFEQLR